MHTARADVPIYSQRSKPSFRNPQALGARGIIVEDVLLKSVKLPDQLTRVRDLCLTCAYMSPTCTTCTCYMSPCYTINIAIHRLY